MLSTAEAEVAVMTVYVTPAPESSLTTSSSTSMTTSYTTTSQPTTSSTTLTIPEPLISGYTTAYERQDDSLLSIAYQSLQDCSTLLDSLFGNHILQLG
ncbi:MAG: hypothetical protein NTU61_05680 [Candidatus Altiarchaeota archaeon]|nr:hypothetical protein [Candidatus Altiarchaeota archaeon]